MHYSCVCVLHACITITNGETSIKSYHAFTSNKITSFENTWTYWSLETNKIWRVYVYALGERGGEGIWTWLVLVDNMKEGWKQREVAETEAIDLKLRQGEGADREE